MQYLSQYFPVMPTWINIESVMIGSIVQPNGTILSQYRQISDHHRQKSQPSTPSKNDQQSSQFQQQKKKETDQYELEKKLVKEKLLLISKQVVQASRKLFRQAYEKELNKLLIDRSLVYYRFKHNILVIIVVKKFSVQIKQIQELISKVFNWYCEKCVSMNIEMNLPNVSVSRYELGQFKKLEWEIANQIDQRVSTSEVANMPTQHKEIKQQFIKEKFLTIGETIINREQRLRQIGQKAHFHSSDSQLSSSRSSNRSSISNMMQKVLPKVFKEKQPKTRKFKRQLSFMEKSVLVAKEMRIRLFLFYFCFLIVVTLGGMVYLGWFQEEE